MSKSRNTASEYVQSLYDSIPKFNSISEYSNYLSQNPFSSNPNFSCDLSIDFFRFFFSCEQYDKNDIINLLRNFNVSTYLLTQKKGKFTLSLNGRDYNAHFFRITVDNYYMGTLLRISKPSKELLLHLHNLLTNGYHINQVEFTADLFANNTAELFGVMKNTACIKWAGTPLNLDVDTFYANNPRKVKAMGCRGYIKEHAPGQTSARIEVLAKRNFFSRKKIHDVNDVLSLTGDYIFSRLSFNELKEETISKKSKKVALENYSKSICNISMGNLADAFNHAALTDHLRYGIADMNRMLKDLMNRGVYLKQHPFHDFFSRRFLEEPFFNY